MSSDSTTPINTAERLLRLETEVEAWSIKFKEEQTWRIRLEEWILEKFGYDLRQQIKNSSPAAAQIVVEVVSSQSNFSPPPPNNEELDIELEEIVDFEIECEKGSTESDTPSESKSASTDSIKDNTSTGKLLENSIKCVNQNPEPLLQPGAQPVVLTKQFDQTSPRVSIMIPESNDNSKEESSTRIQDPIRSPRVKENTEYHVTLKAKNAIQKIGDNIFRCDECQQIFDNVYKGEGHARHHFETKFKCTECPLYFSVEPDMQAHAQEVHNKLKKRQNLFTCYIRGCPWTTRSPEALRNHRAQKHKESNFIVQKSIEIITQSSTMVSSSNVLDNSSVLPFECSDSPNKLGTEGKTDVTMIQVQGASQKTETDDLISYRGRINGERSQWQCKVCEKSFGELSLAKTHVGKSHFSLHFTPRGENRHVICKFCKKAFANENWLKRHEVAEHRGIPMKYYIV